MGSHRSLYSFSVRPAGRNAARATGYLLDVRARVEYRWGKHLAGSKGRCETVSLRSSLPNCDESQLPSGYRLSAFSCYPNVRIPAPAPRAEVLVEAPGECHRFRRETMNPDLPVPAGQLSARLHR